MKLCSLPHVAALALAIAAGAANADVISLYGDKDGSYVGTGYAGTITDTALLGTQSWTQTFAVDGAITSATIELGTAFLGYFPPAGTVRLFLDDVLLGNLSDTDCSDGPCVGTYAVDLLSIGLVSSLSDGVANLRIETGSGDGWALDYSEIKITTSAVPEPGMLWIAGLGLLGVAWSRRTAIR